MLTDARASRRDASCATNAASCAPLAPLRPHNSCRTSPITCPFLLIFVYKDQKNIRRFYYVTFLSSPLSFLLKI